MRKAKGKAASLFFEEIEKDVKEKETFIQNQIKDLKEMKDNFNYLVEYKSVVSKAIEILGSSGVSPSHPDEEAKGQNTSINLEDGEGATAKDPLILGTSGEISLGHIAGTIHTDE